MEKQYYEILKLENQLCFPLYAASKEIIKSYGPILSDLSLTYTQYIVMLVLWEHEKLSVKELGNKLYLDSGTLTPVVNSLKEKGYIKKERNKDDERVIEVSLTENGLALKDKAVEIPFRISQCVALSKDEAKTLYSLLYKLLRK